jgi:hypothetical protein
MSKGGYGDDTGVITGRSHAEGGERMLDHVEVEKGEVWGVLNKRASRKYGKAFKEMVNSFNKDIIVERSDVLDMTSANSRLDKVEYQLIKLNRHFESKTDVTDNGNVRIERRGYSTRIIRKNV